MKKVNSYVYALTLYFSFWKSHESTYTPVGV